MSRLRCMQAKWNDFVKKLGPGLITGASDDDPSGIATYSQAGALFGLTTLWMAIVTFPLMYVIQEMCARISIATSKGLLTNIINHFPRSIVYLILLLTIPAIILNISADIAAMGAVLHLIFPAIPSPLFAIVVSIVLILAIIFFTYQRIALILKYFCLTLLLYCIVPFLAKQNWGEVIQHTFVPTFQFDKSFINITVAILGTTISPYLFFWQSTMVAIELKTNTTKRVSTNQIKEMRADVGTGMFASNVVMYFIILTTGTVLNQHGIHQINTVEQAAKALEPLAGKLCYLLFTCGIIGTALLAIPIFSSCIAYLLSALFNYEEGLEKKYYEAKLFYVIVASAILVGLDIDLIGISPIKALIWTAVLYGVSTPPLILIILILANNKKVMGKLKNGWLSNTVGSITFIFMSAAALLLGWLTVV